MKMSGNEFLNRVKGILKRVSGVQRLLNLKWEIIQKRKQIHELSSLIEENRIVIFPSYSRMVNDVTLTCEMVQEVVTEWFDLYGIVRLRKTTLNAINSPAETLLLYVPQALIKIPSSHEEYIKSVRHETRREIRLAERQGYEFKEFNWNDHLDEIFEINTSKEERQSEPMHGWYREPVQPRNNSKAELQYRKYYGAFKDGQLWAYLHFWRCGDFAILKHIIGHAQHLKYGIMNSLISYTLRECIENSQIRWLYYGRYQEGSSLSTFKKHAGFQKYALLLDLKDDQELLKYSKRTVKTWWRV